MSRNRKKNKVSLSVITTGFILNTTEKSHFKLVGGKGVPFN